MTHEMIAAIAIAAAAGLMRGFAGVGSGMLMAPFFVHLFDPVRTVAIIVLIEIAATVQMLPSVRSSVDWRTVGPMGAAAALLMPVGSWLLVSVETSRLQFIVSLTVFLSALVLMSGWRYSGARPIAGTLGVGAVSGLLMSLTSLGNPPVMIYLLSGRDAAASNRANFTAYFAVTLAALAVILSLKGLVTLEVLGIAALLCPGFLIAVLVGGRLFKRSNERLYRLVALSVILMAGLFGMTR